MLAIILGGMLFGFAGFILALPIAAILKVLFDASPRTEAFGFILGDLEDNDEEPPIEYNNLLDTIEDQNNDVAEELEIRN